VTHKQEARPGINSSSSSHASSQMGFQDFITLKLISSFHLRISQLSRGLSKASNTPFPTKMIQDTQDT
jgi:hypothetical protein